MAIEERGEVEKPDSDRFSGYQVLHCKDRDRRVRSHAGDILGDPHTKNGAMGVP